MRKQRSFSHMAVPATYAGILAAFDLHSDERAKELLEDSERSDDQTSFCADMERIGGDFREAMSGIGNE